MIGKTNVNCRNTNYAVGGIVATLDDHTYLPRDCGLDYFDRVDVAVHNNNPLNLMCRNQDFDFDADTAGDDITCIPAHLMRGYQHLGKVVVPSTVTSIGEYAFSATTATEVSVQAPTVTTMSNVFSSCAALTKAYVNCPSAQCLYLFSGCGELQELRLDGIAELSRYCLQNTKKLSELVVPAMATAIASDAFSVTANNIPTAPLHLTLTRRYIVQNGVVVQNCMTFATAAFRNRNAPDMFFYVPLDSLCAYRAAMRINNSGMVGRIFPYLDCAVGDSLPTTLTQTQSNTTETYGIVWYQDRACTVPAGATASQAARYYGVATLEV